MKKVITVMLAAAMLLSVSASMSGCSLREQSPADTYSSPLRSKETKDEADNEQQNSGGYTEKDYGTDKNSSDSDKSIVSDIISKLSGMTESKNESKTESKKSESKSESKTESKKSESKAAGKTESKKSESKAASKTESKKAESNADTKVESRTASKADNTTESKADNKDDKENKDEKKDESSALYKDIISLIKDDDEIVGYAICKLVGSEDEHLIIEYGGIDYEEEDDTDTSNIIILDPEGYAREQEEKAAAREDEIEQSRLFSIYRIDTDRVIPEGDLSGYFTTAYISSNTGTLGMYYTKDTVWRFGLVELDGNSAFVNFSNEGTLEETGSFPALPGDTVNFSEPGKYDIFKKYK